jgi:integrase
MERYEDGAAHVIRFIGPAKLRTLRPGDVTRFMRAAEAAGLTPWQVKYAFGCLRAALRFAVGQEVLSRVVTDGCTPPTVDRARPVVLTPPQVQAVLAQAARHRLHALWTLALTTGLRRGELLGLRWEDVDTEVRTIAVRRSLQRVRGAGKPGQKSGLQFGLPKTAGSERLVAMPPVAARDLDRWAEEQQAEVRAMGRAYDAGLCFPTAFGKPTDPRSLGYQFKRLLARAGVPPCRLHDLRHTFASLMVAAGADQKALQAAMGHESIRTTLDLYAHLFAGSQRAGADALGAFLERDASKSASKDAMKGGEMAK